MADSKLLGNFFAITSCANVVLLDISRLDEVVNALKSNNFSKAKWDRLGLSLGLYMPTLESIEVQYRGDVDRCLMKCLTLWLQKKDNARLPSWISLASALNEIDEKAVSEKIIEISK